MSTEYKLSDYEGPWNDPTPCAVAFSVYFKAGKYRYGLDALQQAYAWWCSGWRAGARHV